jgi:4-amino-4-deoxy-L-arabinose transferase-like glycosyltransferase
VIPKPHRITTFLTRIQVIAIIALVIRLYSLTNYIDHKPHQALGAIPFLFEPGNIAFSIATGHGFASPFRTETGPTAWMTPIYPEILAGIFKVFGKYTYEAFLAAALLNIFFSTLTTIPIYLTAKKIKGPAVAATAAWLWAIFPQAIVLPYEALWDASMGALLAATILWATLEIKRNWLACGLLWGTALMTTASLASVLPFLLTWQGRGHAAIAAFPRAQWKFPALTALTALLICLPWTIRNYQTFQTLVPLRTVFGLSLWLGNNEKADGTSTSNQHPISNQKERNLYIEQGEIAYNQTKEKEALHYIANNPAHTLLLTTRRFKAIWTAGSVHPIDEFLKTNSNWTRWVLLFNITAALLGAAGTIILFKTNNPYAIPAAVFPIIYALPYYITLAPPRYRHPLDPALLILAAVSIQAIWQNESKRFRKRSKSEDLKKKSRTPATGNK